MLNNKRTEYEVSNHSQSVGVLRTKNSNWNSYQRMFYGMDTFDGIQNHMHSGVSRNYT